MLLILRLVRILIRGALLIHGLLHILLLLWRAVTGCHLDLLEGRRVVRRRCRWWWGIRGRCCGGYGRRVCRVPDQVDFTSTICRPKVDCEDVVRCVNFTAKQIQSV